LKEAFEESYEDGRYGSGSDGRPESLEDARTLAPKWQKIWQLEEILGIELDVWQKKRATSLTSEDLDKVLEKLVDELNVKPVLVEVNK